MIEEKLVESPFLIHTIKMLAHHFLACDEADFVALESMGALNGPAEGGASRSLHSPSLSLLNCYLLFVAIITQLLSLVSSATTLLPLFSSQS